MKHFLILIDGVPPVEVANKFWVEIARYEVNFLVLDRQCFIYGDADDKIIDILLEKAKRFGYAVNLERS